MTTSEWITIWGIAIGLFTTIIGSVLLMAFHMGSLHREVKLMGKTLETVVHTIRQMGFAMAQMEVKLEVMQVKLEVVQVKLEFLWNHHLGVSRSPMVLNETGLRLLEKSRIDQFADEHYAEIVSKVRAAGPQNAYQAQQTLISVLSSYQHVEAYRTKLEETAFASGSDLNSLLFVAALTIRDRVIEDLGFNR